MALDADVTGVTHPSRGLTTVCLMAAYACVGVVG